MISPLKSLIHGNWLMGLCGGFYLAWWLTAFRPPKPRSTPVCTILLTLAFLAGIAGFYFCARTLATPPVNMLPGIRNLHITLGGAAAYVILLAVSVLVFHRMVTSELLIITAWAVLELCVVNTLYRCENLVSGTAVRLSVWILAAALVSLVCYLLYYRLPYTAGYIDGCIPLVLAIAVILAVNLSPVGII
ncbi:MAG: hypothetical protein IJT94_10690 [Oscillibacter sp.]|nr:hypothetical protein [Oscillibacter sp.]